MEYATLFVSIAVVVTLAVCAVLFSRKLNAIMRSEESSEQDIQENRQKTADIAARQDMMVKSMDSFAVQTEQKLENIRSTMNQNLTHMQEDNSRQLDSIRKTVDEKLQESLEKRLTQSFMQVSNQLEQVYKGLGEMQSLASGVGDLKKVLSNVKTRGILGEVQLGAILEQILSPQQYVTNVVTKPGTSERVEYAVCLPGGDDAPVYLPIDAKFPVDAYSQLLDAYDTADAAQVAAASKLLYSRVKIFAKDIHDKYIQPPFTTDFAIMFLPVEGLYAELVRGGMVEELQSLYKINIAGPTTMGALLNSLQMGFKTLAIQKRSSEVWKTLSNVKYEFETFQKVLESAQSRITQANSDLDKLIGVRTRQIQKTLKSVQSLEGDLSSFLPEDSE